MTAAQTRCPKCQGEGWLWSHELDVTPEPHPSGHDDTRYSCDHECHAEDPDGVGKITRKPRRPSPEKTARRQALDEAIGIAEAYRSKHGPRFLNVGAACEDMIAALRSLRDKE